VNVPEDAVKVARVQGWLAGEVRETPDAWLFFALDGRLICRVPKSGSPADGGGDRVKLESVPADVIARAFARGWREGPVEATDWGWIFRSDDAPPVLVGARPEDDLLSVEDIVEVAWAQGFRVEESDYAWYFYPPQRADACCGIARSQARDPRVLYNLIAALREAGLCVAAPPHQPPDVSSAAP
jgi:hypothetical protein